jgi:hypothetical protein
MDQIKNSSNMYEYSNKNVLNNENRRDLSSEQHVKKIKMEDSTVNQFIKEEPVEYESLVSVVQWNNAAMSG